MADSKKVSTLAVNISKHMIIFKPGGQLDIQTDPTSLPQSISGTTISSNAMKRCKNLRVDNAGVAITRDGSSKASSTSTYIGALEAGLMYPDYSAIEYSSYNSSTENIFTCDGTNRKRIESSTAYEWGIAAPTVAPVLTAGAGTGLEGHYLAKYTYCRKEGTTVVSESNPSPLSNNLAVVNQSVLITFTASSDTQVTHVRVYRNIANGGAYYHVADVAVGTLTYDSDEEDTELSSQVETTHDRPPSGCHFVFGPNYAGYCFIILNNLLYYSLAKQPEYWPSAYYLEVSQVQYPLIMGLFHNGAPYVMSAHNVFYIQGTGADTFYPIKMDSITGVVNKNCAVSVMGQGIFHVGTDGIYLWASKDKKVTDQNLDPIFRGETVNGIPGISDITKSWLKTFKNSIYFGYVSTGYTYPTNCIKLNLETGKISYFSWGTEFKVIGVDNDNAALKALDSSDYIWTLENTSLTKDNTTAVSWEIESKDFILGIRKHYPRWVKYDVDATSATSVKGEVILDGTTLQEHTITGNRQTKRRLTAIGNGDRLSIKISGSGPVKIYGVESE